MHPRILAALLLVFCISTFAAEPTQTLRDLLAAEWEYTMEQSPTWASQLGDRRYNNRWPDVSVAAREKGAAHGREFLAQLAKIERAQLPPEERVNYDLAKYENELALEEFAARLWTLPVSQREGIQLLDDFASGLRFETVRDYDDWIARLRGLPAYLEQTTALLRLGILEKRTHAKVVMEGVPGQIEKQMVEKPEESGFYKPFFKFPAAIPEPDRARLSAAAAEAIAKQVVPAYRAFGEFFKTEYLPACTDAVGAWQWPDGEKTYALTARKFTTTKLTPREIHEIGLREVERIGHEMQRVIEQVQWKGTKQEFFAFLRGAPRFYCATPRGTARRVSCHGEARGPGPGPRLPHPSACPLRRRADPRCRGTAHHCRVLPAARRRWLARRDIFRESLPSEHAPEI
jgi:uncharacterized protein (DUF885 family)